jgi:hypothetical protein
VRDRYVLVVPANAPDTLAYLTESLRHVSGVDVVADRRRASAPSVTAPLERRAVRRTQEAFGCRLVRIERAPAPPAPTRDPVRLRDLPLLGDE